jgi:4-amino-4-deoxy-L-arabinose transferase-like glycosyltransferase
MTQPQQQTIEAVGEAGLSARGSGDALSATANPPLYYLLQAAPYKLAGSGKVLDRLAAMRVVSALMGSLTVLLVFLFLRELLPGRGLAWSAGALVVAFQPLFAFISGGVNNDNLLYLAAAGVLWGVARAFRSGLTPATGATIGAFLGIGLVAKLTLLGFIPAVALALALLLRRGWSQDRREALRGAAVAVGLTLAPMVVYLLLSRLVWHRALIPGGVGGVPAAGGRMFNFREELSHVWQLFLPPLWMRHQFGYYPLWDTWFKGFVGRLGWLDYGFPAWACQVAFAGALVVVALAVSELARHRATLRGRLGELSVYTLAVVGLCVEIGVQSYRFLIVNGGQFEQARYLLSLLALYGAIVALAVRWGGRRFGPALAAALVVAAIGYDVFAQVLTIARYST